MAYLKDLFAKYTTSELTPNDFAFIFISGGNKVSGDMNILRDSLVRTLGCRVMCYYGNNSEDPITVKIIKAIGGLRAIFEIGADITNSQRIKQYIKEYLPKKS